MASDIEVLIIGAGVIGLALGEKITEKGKQVAIVEKNFKYGLETSSRNSEVIHSGIHYPKNSLKAKLCVEGNYLLYKVAEKNNLTYKKTGKITVATTKQEISLIEKLYLQGKENGVKDIYIIDKKKIEEIEPDINAEVGLVTPTSGIINVHQLMDYLANKFKDQGGFLATGEKVIGIEKLTTGYKVISKSSEGINKYKTDIVINCAGLWSDEISKMLKIKYKLYWAKGDYFSLPLKFSVSSLIYPVPTKTSLGIHLTPKIGGGYRIGPDIEYVEKKEKPYPIAKEISDFKVDEGKKEKFYYDVVKYLPNLKIEDMQPEMYGIRPKLQGEKDLFKDFIIKDERENSCPSFINLIGIESPGLTSCLSIAEYVVKKFL